jgi:hypothetical protein
VTVTHIALRRETNGWKDDGIEQSADIGRVKLRTLGGRLCYLAAAANLAPRQVGPGPIGCCIS